MTSKDVQIYNLRERVDRLEDRIKYLEGFLLSMSKVEKKILEDHLHKTIHVNKRMS